MPHRSPLHRLLSLWATPFPKAGFAMRFLSIRFVLEASVGDDLPSFGQAGAHYYRSILLG